MNNGDIDGAGGEGAPPDIAETGVAVTPTGIEDLDTVLQGGIPDGHTILLTGSSGTGKTVLSMEWLFRGYERFEHPGLYVTLTESVTEATANLAPMSFYQQSLVKGSKVRFADLRTTFQILGVEEGSLDKTDIDDIIGAIEQLVEETGARRVVIDSITAIAYLLEERDLIRTFVFRLGTMLNHHDVTTILTSEVPDEGYSRYGVEEFVSDGIITLSQESVADDLRRTLQVVKMRGHDYLSEEFHFTIDSDGIDLSVHDYGLEFPVSDKRLSIGVSGLDNMMGGGPLEGSITLVTGAAGVGKTLTGLHFLQDGLGKDETVLYVGFEESEEQVRQMAEHFGWDTRGDRFLVSCRRPTDGYPEQHLDRIAELVAEHDVDRVVVDSLSAMNSAYGTEHHQKFARDLTMLLKSKAVTGVVTAFSSNLTGSGTETEVSTMVDNILLLNTAEVDGRLQRSITVLKTRGSAHDDDIREYNIGRSGIKIGAPMRGYEGLMTGSARKTGDNIVEQVGDEFAHALGPMGRADFEDLRADGLTRHEVEDYIAGLEDDNVLGEAEAEEFRYRVRRLLEGRDVSARVPDEEDSDDTGRGFFERVF